MLLALALSLTVHAQTNCEALYERRSTSAETCAEALRCFEAERSSTRGRLAEARTLNRLAYLRFFQAEYYLGDSASDMLAAAELAESAVLLFGKKYDLAAYRGLTAPEQEELSLALYHHGLMLARYVDLRGVAEALRRMDDIKRSMTTILRLGQQAIAFNGAHRTLGIFHTKVPTIAGGDIEIAKSYLPLAIAETRFSGDLSRYPLNNIAYADLLLKLNRKAEGCAQLKLVASLTASDVEALDNGMSFETMNNVREAQRSLSARQCP